MNIKIGTALIYASFFQHGIFLVLHVIQFLVFAAKPIVSCFLRQVIPSIYRRNDNKLGKASTLDLMKALPLNSDKGCTSVLCSEGVEICHPHKTDNTVQLLRLLCISYGNLSMKKALKTSLKCFFRNPIAAF